MAARDVPLPNLVGWAKRSVPTCTKSATE